MAIFMLVIGTMWGRSVLSLVPRWRERQKGASQCVVVVAGTLALVLTYTAPNTLVRLSLISYEGMAQLLPMLLLGLVWRRMTLLGACSGLVVGVGVVCAFVFSDHDPVWGVNAGIVALGVNLVVALAVTYAGPRDHDRRPDGELLARDPIGGAGDGAVRRPRRWWVLTEDGVARWPVLRSLGAWGRDHVPGTRPMRTLHHGTELGAYGECPACAVAVPPGGCGDATCRGA